MAEERVSMHGQWSGKLAFVLAATGSAVGLGNVWKFPYIAGENGGGAFVLVYLIFIAIIGIPIMMSEIMLGRRGRQSPYYSMYILAAEELKSRRWAWLGGVGALAGFIIMSYYSVVAGQVMAYVVRAFTGTFRFQSADGIRSLYENFRSNPEAILAWHTIFMVMTVMVVSRGVRHGLEKAVRYLIPALIVLLVLLVGYAMHTAAFHEGFRFLFVADFEKLFYARDALGNFVLDANGDYLFTFKGILVAMGHAFFTLSLGMGAIMIYGAYLDRRTSIASMAITVSVADTIIALLAGLAIFPIVFDHQLNADIGPSLIFETLPIAFGSMPYGQLFGTLFFVLLTFAAWTSAISIIEPAVTWVIERFNLSRVKASVWVGIAAWLLGVVSVFSATGTNLRDIGYRIADFFDVVAPDLRHKFYDMTAFQVLDGFVTQVLLPVGGILIAVFAGWLMRPESSMDELDLQNPRSYKVWYFVIRYVSPAAVLIVFVVGVVNWVTYYLTYTPVQ